MGHGRSRCCEECLLRLVVTVLAESRRLNGHSMSLHVLLINWHRLVRGPGLSWHTLICFVNSQSDLLALILVDFIAVVIFSLLARVNDFSFDVG